MTNLSEQTVSVHPLKNHPVRLNGNITQSKSWLHLQIRDSTAKFSTRADDFAGAYHLDSLRSLRIVQWG